MRALILVLWILTKQVWMFGLLVAFFVLIGAVMAVAEGSLLGLYVLTGTLVYVVGGALLFFGAMPTVFRQSLERRVARVNAREGLRPGLEQFSYECKGYVGIDTSAGKIVFWHYAWRDPWVVPLSDLVGRTETETKLTVTIRFVLADGRSYLFDLTPASHAVFNVLLHQHLGW